MFDWFLFLLTVALFHRRSLDQGNQYKKFSFKVDFEFTEGNESWSLYVDI